MQLLSNELTTTLRAPSSLPGDVVSGIVIPNLSSSQPPSTEDISSEQTRDIIENNYFSRSKRDAYPAWMPFPFSLPDSKKIQAIIDTLCDLPSTQMNYFATREDANDTQQYPALIEEALGLKKAKQTVEDAA